MRSYRASEALWRDVLGTNKSGSLSCVFNSRNIADTWWVIKHKPSLPESSWGLIFVLLSLQINLQTTLLGHPSAQYLPKLDHLTGCSVFVKANTFVGFAAFALWLQACHCFGYKATHCFSESRYRFSPQYSERMSCWLNHLWVEASLGNRGSSWDELLVVLIERSKFFFPPFFPC